MYLYSLYPQYLFFLNADIFANTVMVTFRKRKYNM